jgi:hypothetical protein
LTGDGGGKWQHFSELVELVVLLASSGSCGVARLLLAQLQNAVERNGKGQSVRNLSSMISGIIVRLHVNIVSVSEIHCPAHSLGEINHRCDSGSLIETRTESEGRSIKISA